MSEPQVPIRVLIVEDSPVVRALLEAIIDADERLQVVGVVSSGEEALRKIPRLKPDVISMDVRLPGIDGLQTTRRIMQEYPTPIVVVTGHRSQAEMNEGFDALKAGALSVLDKPAGPLHPDFERQAKVLCTQLVIMSQIKVIRQRPRRVLQPPVRSVPPASGHYDLLGVVASTGGPKALSQLLNALGAGFPLPVLLVQHITSSFLGGFVEWLNAIAPLKACIADDGELPQPGRIYLAQADRHLVLRQGRLRLLDTPQVSYQRPSGTVLLESMAKELGARGIGVVLTGMGDDGAAGLLKLRQAGGYTLAESEATAVVYGMPAVCVKLDAACEVLPIYEIGPHLNEML